MAAEAQGRDMPRAIRGQVRRLRASLRVWHLVAGVRTLLYVGLGLCGVSLLADWLWRMDLVQRRIFLLLSVLALLWVLWRRALRPLLARVSDEGLIALVEARHPHTHSTMISAAEFCGRTPGGASPELVETSVTGGVQWAGEVDFASVLDWRRFRRNMLHVLLVLAVVGVTVAAVPEVISIWFARNVCMQSVEWPRRTRIQVVGVVDGCLRIPRGAPLEIVARVDGVVPDTLRLNYIDAQDSRFEEQMAQRDDGAFRSSFTSVSEGFDFRIRGGDGMTEWIEVQLLPRPEIADLVVSALPPAYVGGDPILLDKAGRYDVLRGSTLKLAGRSSLPLVRAACRYDGQDLVTTECDDAHTFTLPLSPAQLMSGTYEVRVYSTDEVANDPLLPVHVSVRQDAPPDAELALNGLGRIALPRARVPVTYAVRDAYGLAAASVEVSLLSDAAEAVNTSSHSLDNFSEDGRAAEGALVIEPGELGAREGQTLMLEAKGVDKNDMDGPGVGVSLRKTVRFVGEEELHAEILSRESSLQRLVRTVMITQQQMLDATRLMRSQLARGKTLSRPQREGELLAIEKQQQRQAQRLTSLAGQAQQLAAEVFNNRLEADPQPIYTRLSEAVAAPLARLCEQALPETMADIFACRRALDAELPAGLYSIEMRQRLILRVLGDVADRLRTQDDMTQLAQELRRLLDAQERLAEQAAKAAESAAEELFE